MDLLFKALQDPTRRRILEMLKKRDLNAGEIADAFRMSKPSISYHLDLLKQANLVSARRDGQFIVYSLETTVLDESIGWIIALIEWRKTHANASLAKGKLAADRHPGGSLYRRRGVLG
ncbi:MAG: autorepressor SdpR family transcription factor [Opitutaceae bacterium]|jgi:ArsR family transcriptional regulator, arsenate/arsenite/antimonite-responsive transcriptional repressor